MNIVAPESLILWTTIIFLLLLVNGAIFQINRIPKITAKETPVNFLIGFI